MNKKAVVHVHEVRPRKDKRGFDLISDALPFARKNLRPVTKDFPLPSQMFRKNMVLLQKQ
jgi:hypothetical protein